MARDQVQNGRGFGVPADLSLGKLWSRRKSRHLTRYHRRRSRRGVGGGRTGSGCISENGRARQNRRDRPLHKSGTSRRANRERSNQGPGLCCRNAAIMKSVGNGEPAMKLEKLGVWAGTDVLSAADAATFAKRVEAWGYGALWIPEAVGREVFSASAWLLANTHSLIVASGIANIYARDSFSAAAAQKGLNEQSGGRFLLGLGVSHIPLVEGLRQHQYGKPVATMRSYSQAIGKSPYQSVPPVAPPRTVLAALGPK